MYVNNTAYFLNGVTGGTGFNPAATADTYIDLVAEGFDATGQSVGTAKIRLQDGLTSMTEWTKFDLSSLGAVASIKLGYEASEDQFYSYGYAAPGYVAIDDIAVRIPMTATFEDIKIDGTESFWADKTLAGINYWNSSYYTFDTYYADYGYDYFADFVVSNCTQTDGIDYTKPYQSTAGGAKYGKNYAVFYGDSFSPVDGGIYMASPGTVSGFWVCNTTYTAYGIKNGDGMSPAFGQDDYFKLIITGYNIDKEETGTVEQMLIDCTDANEWYYVKDWRWVDLTSLGNDVMFVKFSFDGTKKNSWGLTTPTYFCIDDFCGAAPFENTPYTVIEQSSGISSVAAKSNVPAVRKVMQNGRLVIINGDKQFNIGGAQIK